ncbi:GCN5-related N-acetyltransferase [Kribbella flavida DSM 17836]|uniref:GCN5-related N-acetyltransferase n=1 Tax=Kribbella flavida (strain DSM 17836 / JCM 10339 / NBRC 14399) TaxID=479435 RepID=D2PM27_KRIFD|nr:GNAT family N-acetyltransferase [Kribbella flavida]ADB34395.1 GCN5-related N-acetyltransferase [Kribbella flavida DSM 17836]
MDKNGPVRAIEHNTAELLLAMGRAGGGTQRDDPGLRWTLGGSPIDYHNAVVAADLTAEEADRAIAESLRLLRTYGVPGSWHVGPSTRPRDLGDRLLAAGFTYGGSEPGMAVEPAVLSDEPTGPGNLRIARVLDEQSLAVWAATLGRGFGEGPKEADWVASVYRHEGFDDPWRHYLGTLDGVPVATATVFLTPGVAGVYFVMTVPEARRQGIGAAITRYAVRAAADVAQYAVLGSSPAGRSVYESLGFRQYCTIDLYEWAPDS